MSFDRKDFQSSAKDHQIERAEKMIPVARLIAGAVPVMTDLTQNESWNRYLTILQGFIERWTQARETARNKLSDPAIWIAEDLIKLKADILVAQATIDALQTAMQLPNLILGGGTAAEEFITQHGVPYEPS
jgi:hypothetical protein